MMTTRTAWAKDCHKLKMVLASLAQMNDDDDDSTRMMGYVCVTAAPHLRPSRRR